MARPSLLSQLEIYPQDFITARSTKRYDTQPVMNPYMNMAGLDPKYFNIVFMTYTSLLD